MSILKRNTRSNLRGEFCDFRQSSKIQGPTLRIDPEVGPCILDYSLGGAGQPDFSASCANVCSPETREPSANSHVGYPPIFFAIQTSVCFCPSGVEHSTYGRSAFASPKSALCAWQCGHQKAP